MNRAPSMQRTFSCLAALTLLASASNSVLAAGADLGQAVKQPTNWTAITSLPSRITLPMPRWI